MTEVAPEELSALLDGELPAHRAREVEAALASNPALRAELAALRHDDTAWRIAADSARFAPAVTRPHRTSLPAMLGLSLLAVIVLRVALKLAGSEAFGFVLAAVALLLLLAGIARLVKSQGASHAFQNLR